MRDENKMKRLPLLLRAAALLLLLSSSSSSSSSVDAARRGKEDISRKEEDDFWRRFLLTSLGPSLDQPTASPTTAPSPEPTPEPSPSPNVEPTTTPTKSPSANPSSEPSSKPTMPPSPAPSANPLPEPTSRPTMPPTPAPSANPSSKPSSNPTMPPTPAPSTSPSSEPSSSPTMPPTQTPTTTPTNQQCEVDVDIKCETSNGQPCDTLDYPRESCGADMDAITFEYVARPCSESRNYQEADAICEDFDSFTMSDMPVMISCSNGSSGRLMVEPSFVVAGGTFTVTSPNFGSLPDRLQCFISNPFGQVMQINTIDTTGDSSLQLFDRFGAMELVSCDDLSCMEELSYEYTLSNVGSAEMDITVIDWTYNGITTSLLQSLNTTVLAPGETIVLQDVRVIDVCLKGSYSVAIDAQAEPPNGEMCQAANADHLTIIPDCIVDLAMSCTVDRDGSECASLTGVNQQQCVCAASSCVNQMEFRYTGANCDESVICSDFSGGPSGVSVVEMTVADENGIELFSGEVSNGDAVALGNGEAACIGRWLLASITDPTSGNDLQKVIIDSSCELGADITLLDSFGSMDFIGFQCLGGARQNCFEDVTYELRSENDGNVDFDITEFEVTLNGVTTNVIETAEPDELKLSPGEDFILTKEATLELCVDSSYSARARVEGTTEGSSVVCKDKEQVEFVLTVGTLFPTASPSSEPTDAPTPQPSPAPSPRPSRVPSSAPSQDPSALPSAAPSSMPSAMPTNDVCLVDVDINCTTTSGRECDAIGPAEGTCYTDERIDVITFQYVPSTCEGSRNEQDLFSNCQDGAFSVEEAVLVFCASDGARRLSVRPMVVFPMGTFVVSNPDGALPENVECSIMTVRGETLQTNTIDTSGTVPLSLSDVFGALRVESCDELSCIEELCYNYTISNIGSAEMEVTVVDHVYNGVTEDLLDLVPTNPLLPGQSTSFSEKRTVNTCIQGNFSTEIDVQAEPSDGEMCQEQEEYNFSIIPDCIADLEVTCSVDDDGSDCARLTDPITPQCVCAACVSAMVFRYTATTCDSDNVGENGLIGCEDLQSSGPSPFAARVMVQTGSRVLANTVVGAGASVLVGDESCIDDSIVVSISDPMTGNVWQEVEIDTLCKLGSSIVLLESFGAVDFIGYTCQGEEAQNCFVDTTYTLRARNIGLVDLTVSEFLVDINGNRADLVTTFADDELILSPGDELEATETVPFERCVESLVYYRANLAAETIGSEAVCTDEDGRPGFPLQLGTSFPTIAPSSQPSEPPTALPSFSPSAPPSLSPTPEPSAEPSATPTASPSAEPSAEPSPGPSFSPSTEPSETPTSAPSPSPTSTPTESPSKAPSPAPTKAPSPAPTEACVISLDVDCTLADNNSAQDGKSCEAEIGVEPCLERPTGATMLYTGGDCSQSDNIQPLKFTCEDRNGGPPTEEGTLSYIVVTDIKGKGIVYFEGFVGVGAEYPLNDDGERFEADQFIMIYSSDDTSNPDNSLQVVQYHSSCSQNLELKNRFGASQLVGFYNELQGNVTCFATANFALAVELDFDVSGDGVTLSTLTADTNFAGFLDLTDLVAGALVEPGGTTVVTLQGEIDLTERKRYTIFAELTGRAEPNSQALCTGTDYAEFLAGNPAPPNTPTEMPSLEPTISPAPTPDPEFAACELDATILCATLGDPEPSESSCSSLGVPSEPMCMSPGTPSQFRWLYNGLPCSASNTESEDFRCKTQNGGPSMNPPSDVFISVVSVDEDLVYFAGTVRFGSTFVVFPGGESNRFENEITVSISELDGSGEPGRTLQVLELRAQCRRGSDIRLLAQYGALQLVGYESSRQGLQSAFEEIELTYVLENSGPIAARVDTILVNSTFTGERHFASGMELGRGASESITFSTPINLYAANGMSFFNEFVVAGTGLRNVIVCQDTASLDITIGGGP